MTGCFKELDVYQLASGAARTISLMSKKFPKEETYPLTDQIRRSSRSVCTNAGEGYGKHIYPKHFTETSIRLDFAFNREYPAQNELGILQSKYEKIGRVLNSMANHPEFTPKTKQ